jgi:hypothetical protein
MEHSSAARRQSAVYALLSVVPTHVHVHCQRHTADSSTAYESASRAHRAGGGQSGPGIGFLLTLRLNSVSIIPPMIRLNSSSGRL